MYRKSKNLYIASQECQHAHVDTHDFQAVKFYKKNEYEICDQLNNLPEEYNQYLLKKDLT
jgi:hypothetical protein